MPGLVACAGAGKPVQPGHDRIPNLRLQQVVVTQETQDSAGPLPCITGPAAGARTYITRSIERIDEVSAVLRLFREGA